MAAATTIRAWRGRLSSSPLASTLASTPSPARPLCLPGLPGLLHGRVRGRPFRPFFQLAAAALGQARKTDAAHTLTTTRTLPYADGDLFRLIADVDAYDQFLPHCTRSRVTRWRPGGAGGVSSASGPPSAPSSWPARADLTVGWGPLAQTYSSRVYCIPGRGVVEAVSGPRGTPTLTAGERAELGLLPDDHREEAEDVAEAARLRARSPDDDPFESLVTRWTVVPVPLDGVLSATAPPAAPPSSWSRVELRIRFQFRNPLYQLAAAQVGNEMAAKMIGAFEGRAEHVLGPRQGRL